LPNKFNNKKLQRIREARGLSRDELATAIKRSRQSIWSWETGKCVPDAIECALLAYELDVPVSWLFIIKQRLVEYDLDGNIIESGTAEKSTKKRPNEAGKVRHENNEAKN
jgi:transcriptional regulator with XRE-family HTH domain